MTKVYLIDQHGYNPVEISSKIKTAIEQLGVTLPGSNTRALVDMGFVHPKYAPHDLTNPQFVAGALSAVGAENTQVLANSTTGFPTRLSLKYAHYNDLQVSCLDEGKFTTVNVTDGIVVKKANIAKAWVEASAKVLLPKLRLSASAGITGAMKAEQSLLSATDHAESDHLLPQRMVDLVLPLQPDLIIVDAVQALHDGGEIAGKPVDLGLIVVGTDAIAVDMICAIAMGFEPSEIDHLAEAKQRGLTDLNIHGIELMGELSLDDVKERAKSVIHIERDPVNFPLPEHLHVVRSEKAKQAGVSSTLTEALYLLRNSGFSFSKAPFASLVIGSVSQIPAGKDEYSLIAFLDDTSRGDYKNYGRIVRLPGRNITLAQFLNVIPYVLKIVNFQSELGTELMLSKLVSTVRRLFSS